MLFKVNFKNKVTRFTFLFVKMMDNLLGYDNIVLIPHPWNEAALERPNNVV